MVKNVHFGTKAFRLWSTVGFCLGLMLVECLMPRPAQGIENIGLTNVVWLQGVEPNTNSAGFRNDGLLRLETVDDSYPIALGVDGTITNSETGFVEINAGSGGARLIFADWINQGLIAVNYNLDFSKPKLSFEQDGSFLVGPYALAYADGYGGTFNQNAGDITLDDLGLFRLKDIAFNYNGGTIQGSPYLLNSSLQIAPTGTHPATFIFNGSGSALLGNVPNGCSLIIQGNAVDGDAWVTSTNGFENAGDFSLESLNYPSAAGLIVQSGSLLNLPGGTLAINPGSGGQRGVSANIINNGSIFINATANLSKNSGTMLQSGTFSIAPGQTAYVQGSGQLFEQRSGNLSIDGRLQLFKAVFRYTGGAIQGLPSLYDSSLYIQPSGTNTAVFYMGGPAGRLETDIPVGQSVWVVGSGVLGDSTVTRASGLENNGWLRLVSVDDAYEAAVDVRPGKLTNALGARLSAEFGTGGDRTISGTVLNQARLEVQASTTLTVKGDFQQTATGSCRMDFVGSTNASFPTPLVVSGKAVLDGTLEVRLFNLAPKPGDHFTLVQATNRAGGFKQTFLPNLPNGSVWLLTYSPKSVDLAVVGTNAAPNLSLTLDSPDEAVLLFTAPAGGGYVLEASSNLTSWLPIQTNKPFSGSLQAVQTDLNQFGRRFYRVVPVP